MIRPLLGAFKMAAKMVSTTKCDNCLEIERKQTIIHIVASSFVQEQQRVFAKAGVNGKWLPQWLAFGPAESASDHGVCKTTALRKALGDKPTAGSPCLCPQSKDKYEMVQPRTRCGCADRWRRRGGLEMFWETS